MIQFKQGALGIRERLMAFSIEVVKVTENDLEQLLERF